MIRLSVKEGQKTGDTHLLCLGLVPGEPIQKESLGTFRQVQLSLHQQDLYIVRNRYPCQRKRVAQHQQRKCCKSLLLSC